MSRSDGSVCHLAAFRYYLNSASRPLSKFASHASFFHFSSLSCVAASSSASAPPGPAPARPAAQPTPTVPEAAADAGKDVVHQLNSAFTKVFEIVAPSVVIIEVTKKSDGSEAPLDDLFFQAPG